MIKRIEFILVNLISSKKGFLILFCIALFVNIFWLYVSKTTHNPNGTELYVGGIELEHDLRASESFIETGDYYFGRNCFGEDDFTYRLPGFLFLYLPFRLFLNIHWSLTAIVILQVLLSTLSTISLSRIVNNITNKTRYYYLTFFVFIGSGYVQNHNYGFNREGLTTYVMIFALYFFQKWLSQKKSYYIAIFSVLLTWTILYRAFFILPVFLVFISIIYYQFKENKIIPTKLIVLLFLPSFLFFLYWIPRNYIKSNKLIVLETCYVQSKSSTQIWSLIKTWGGEVLPWIPNSEASWFNLPQNGNSIDDSLMPNFLFNDTLTIDSLKKAREYRWLSNNTSINLKTRLVYDEKAAEIIAKFEKLQISKYPFRSYITSKFKLLFEFLNQPIGARTQNLKYPFNVFFTFFTSFLNYLIFAVGFIASIIMLFFMKRSTIILFGQIFIYSILFTMIILFSIELRRIAHLVPFFIINMLLCFDLLTINNFKRKLWIVLCLISVIAIFAYNSCLININW